MRNMRMSTTTISILLAALLGAIVTFVLFAILLIPLAVLIAIIGG